MDLLPSEVPDRGEDDDGAGVASDGIGGSGGALGKGRFLGAVVEPVKIKKEGGTIFSFLLSSDISIYIQLKAIKR